MKKYTTVSIPKSLAETIEIRIKGTKFKSKSAYVTYILMEIEKEIESMDPSDKREVHPIDE
ncbi:MAG: CopG family transcriptional regulator [Promethearchaeota archaeon]